MSRIAIDTSVLVGLLNPRDIWHDQARQLYNALRNTNVKPTYFDCVATEAISVVVRRLHEKGHDAEVIDLLNQLDRRIPKNTLTWILPDAPRLYTDVLDLIRKSSGALNFNCILEGEDWIRQSTTSVPG